MATPTSDYEVVKWYTRARRFPQLIGKTPDGASLWGGPYTYTQVIGGTIFVILAAKTIAVWGRFGTIGNVLLLAAASYGFVLLLGQIPAGARNPLSVASGIAKAFSSPSGGTLFGTPVRPVRIQRATTRIAVIPAPAAPAPAAPALPEVRSVPAPCPAPVTLSAVQQLLLAGPETPR